MTSSKHITLTPLADAHDAARFGGKASGLARLLALGLPVPPGIALDANGVDEVLGRDESHAFALIEVTRSLAGDGGTVAVRSSALDEDGAAASFAGQHLTKLAVVPKDVVTAMHEVRASGHSASALAYRERLGITTAARVAVVVQRIIEPVAAGVMFTADPLDRARRNVLVVEAAYGLGEAVVAGLVTPDHWELTHDGALLAERLGHKDILLARASDGSGTEERTVDDERAAAPCLNAAMRAQLVHLAAACKPLGDALDVEFAVDASGAVWLLQCRPMTR